MSINTSLKQLDKARNKLNAIDLKRRQVVDELNQVKEKVFMELQKAKLKSARTDDFTVSIAVRNSLQVTHQNTLMEWLKNEPNVEPDLYIQINKRALEPLVKQALKETGEIVPGVEFTQSEYISLRSNKKESK